MPRICICAPTIGAPSETFIRRHVNDLECGAAVVGLVRHPEPVWQPAGPMLALCDPAPKPEPLWLKVGWRLGLPMTCVVQGRWERVEAFLEEHGVEVLFLEYLNRFTFLVEPAVEAGYRVIVHGHGYDFSRLLKNEQVRRSYECYNRYRIPMVVPSRHGARNLEAAGLHPELIYVIPYGVEVQDVAKNASRCSEIRIMAAGRMTGKKAPLLLLESCRRAMEGNQNIVLDYVGDGELMIAAIDFLHIHGLQDRVRLHGALPAERVQDLLKNADLFIQHSRTDPISGDEEGLPVAILEAMSHGLPVISTCHAGIPEAVLHGQTGLLIEEGDIPGMHKAILELATDPERRIGMGEQGRLRIKQNFTWTAEKAKLLELLFPTGKADS